jgi:hypothetical protein
MTNGFATLKTRMSLTFDFGSYFVCGYIEAIALKTFNIVVGVA